MSTIVVPTIEPNCCNGFKVDKVANGTKNSQDNLDFIVTFLNIPQAASNENGTDAQMEINASAEILVQNCSSSEEDIATSLNQNLAISVPNSDNNHENYNENNSVHDITLLVHDDGSSIKGSPVLENTAQNGITVPTITDMTHTTIDATTTTMCSNTNDATKTIEDVVIASTPTTSIQNEEEIDEDSDDEEELTNLTWLTELRNQSITWPSSINPTILDDNLDASTTTAAENNEALDDLGAQNASEKSTVGVNNAVTKNGSNGVAANNETQRQIGAVSGGGKVGATQLKRPTPAERYQIFIDKVKRDLQEYEQSAVNYQTDTTEKPPFNYSHIIGMAMLEKGRVTLQQICSWIESKFAFFRVRKKWNNSIRHNLSLHHCFRKINRNKYEKGKGGYWELGVDPKKCDRKRIRNRKSSNSMNKNKKNNNTVQNNNNSNSSCYSERQEAATTTTLSAPATTATHHHQNQHQLTEDDADIDMELDVQIPADGLEEAEQMLLDDLDVQQNIDISSNQQHQQQQQQLQSNLEHQLQQEEAFIANVLANCIELDPATLNAEVAEQHVGDGNELPTLATVASLQQYQLGTVIISTSTDDMATTLNSFIYNNQMGNNSNQNSSNEFCPAQQHKILYREDEIPQACENVIVSSFLSDAGLDGQHPNNTNPNRPNVIVEPLEPYYSVISASATTLVSTNGDSTTVTGEHFRPYIDGIDEAFQYLRSMDHNRSEDLLDNLLDISVSDY